MKVRCKEILGYQFSRKDVREGLSSKITHMALSKEKVYTVYGILLAQESLEYLIFDDYEMPMWYSADLFEVEDYSFSSNWYYNFWGYDKFGVTAVWGYYELVTMQEHFNGLSDQNEEDIEIFFKYKKKVDEKLNK